MPYIHVGIKHNYEHKAKTNKIMLLVIRPTKKYADISRGEEFTTVV